MDTISSPGAGIGRDIATGDRADAQIDGFISRRHDQRVKSEGERPAEEAFMESERRYDARRRAEVRAAWVDYHEGQAARHRGVLGALVAFHEAEADKYRNHLHEGDAA